MKGKGNWQRWLLHQEPNLELRSTRKLIWQQEGGRHNNVLVTGLDNIVSKA
jgi:hypothetical protein